MRKNWHETVWDDYVAAQSQDRKTLTRINVLLKSIERNGYDAIGNVEPLRGDWSGWWKRPHQPEGQARVSDQWRRS